MTLFEKLMRARDALNYGEQLAKSATWKQRASRTNALVGLLAAVLPFIDGLQHVDPEIITDIASGLGGVYALWNWYIHNATSTKVGI